MEAEYDPTIVRNFAPSDLPFIMSTWLRELHDNYNGPLPDKLWFDVHREFIDSLFRDPRVDIKVLVAKDNEKEIIGYCVAIEGELLIWIHIRKGPLRRQGLALRLMSLMKVTNAPLAFHTLMGRARLRGRMNPKIVRKTLSTIMVARSQ